MQFDGHALTARQPAHGQFKRWVCGFCERGRRRRFWCPASPSCSACLVGHDRQQPGLGRPARLVEGGTATPSAFERELDDVFVLPRRREPEREARHGDKVRRHPHRKIRHDHGGRGCLGHPHTCTTPGGAETVGSRLEAEVRGGEFAAAADLEFAEDVAQMPLDGLAGDVEIVGDLGVAPAGGSQLGDTPLGRGQGIDAGERCPSRACPSRGQFFPDPSRREARRRPGKRSRRPVRSGVRAAVRWPELRSAAPSSACDRASSSRPGERSSAAHDSVSNPSRFSARRRSWRRAKRDAERAAGTGAPGQLELLRTEFGRQRQIAQCGSRLAAPECQ